MLTDTDMIVAFLEPQVLVAIVTVIGGGLMALLTWAIKELVKVRRLSHATHYEVKNSHTTNLREDMDKVIDGQATVLSILSSHGETLSRLELAILTEQAARAAADNALAAKIAAA